MKNFKMLPSGYYRVPIMKNFINYNKKVNKNNILEFYINSKLFREQIYIANKNLYEYIENDIINCKESFENSKKIEKVKETLYIYYKRSLNRNTPFGIFSGIGEISIINESIKEKEISIKKFLKINPDWIELLKESIVNKNFKILKYKINNGIVEEISCIKIFVYKYNEKYCNILEKTEFIEKLLDFGDAWISYDDILRIFDFFEDFGEEEINEIFLELLELRFLISELDLSLKNYNHFKYILNNQKYLNFDKNIYRLLMDIDLFIDNYLCSELGEGTDILKQLNKKMNFIVNTSTNKNMYTVNLQFNRKRIFINNTIKNDFEKLVSYFIYLEDDLVKSHRREISELFLEKYGKYQEVTFFEFFNFVINTDILNKFDFQKFDSYDYKKSEAFNELDKYFFEALLKNEYIDIIDLVDEYNRKDNVVLFPRDFELFIEKLVDKNSKEYYFIDDMYRSNNISATSGRFDFEECNNLGKYDNLLEVEISYKPTTDSLGNLVYGKSIYKYNVNIGTISYDYDHLINLKDIVVVSIDGEILLKDISKNKYLIFKKSDNLNINYLDDISKLLIYVSSGFKINRNPFNIMLHKYDFIPKIKYKNIIINEKMWKFKRKSKDRYSFNVEILDFIHKNELPRFLYVKFKDIKLPIDLNNTDDISILYKICSSKEVLFEKIFEEKIDIYRESLVLKFKNTNSLINDILKDKYKLYKKSENKLLGKYYYFLINIKKEYKLYFFYKFSFLKLRNYFFINYIDFNISSIRIRFLNMDYKEFKKVDNFMFEMKKNNIIFNYIISSFEPEINRYGGEEFYLHYEKIFIRDSELAVESILNKEYDGLVCDYLLKSLSYIFYSNINILYLINDLRNSIDYNIISKMDKIYIDNLKYKFSFEIVESYFDKNLSYLSYNLSHIDISGLLDLIHLTSNRLFDIDHIVENRLKYYLLKLLLKIKCNNDN